MAKTIKLACPYCKSTDIYAVGKSKKGFSAGKAVAGALLTGGIGLIAGFSGKNGKMMYCCSNCNKSFKESKAKKITL